MGSWRRLEVLNQTVTREEPMPLKYTVELTESQRLDLERVVTVGHTAARTIRRAHCLLWSAAGETDAAIAARLGCSPQTVAHTRRRWVKEGMAALEDRPRCGRPPRLDGRQEAHLVALACSEPPEGHGAWTLVLLAGAMVEMGWVEALSPSTVGRVLKKTSSRPATANAGV